MSEQSDQGDRDEQANVTPSSAYRGADRVLDSLFVILMRSQPAQLLNLL